MVNGCNRFSKDICQLLRVVTRGLRLSGPMDLEVSIPLRRFDTPGMEIIISVISGAKRFEGIWKSVPSMKTDLNCEFNASAFCLGSIISFPFT